MGRRSVKKSIIHLNFLFFFLVLILIGVVSSFIKIEYRKRQVEKEIENLQSEIERLGGRNNNLENLLGFLNQEDYLEREAREHLNLKKPGENVAVILPPAGGDFGKIADKNFFNNKNIDPVKIPAKEILNIKKWWLYFFE